MLFTSNSLEIIKAVESLQLFPCNNVISEKTINVNFSTSLINVIIEFKSFFDIME